MKTKIVVAAAAALLAGVCQGAEDARPLPTPLVKVSFESSAGQHPAVEHHIEGGNVVETGQGSHALRLRPGQDATALRLSSPLSSDAGTISFLFKLDQQANAAGSQPLVTLTWGGPARSYLAISQGWWEPTGRDRLYLIVSNESQMHCSTPRRLDPGEWQMVTATWSKGHPGLCRLYIDGVKVAEHQGNYRGGERASGPIYLGSDLGARAAAGRRAAGLLDDLTIFSRSLDDHEIRRMHDEQVGGRAAAERIRWRWLDNELQAARDEPAPSQPQARAMFESNWTWARSRADVDATLARVKAAGFNVLIPCVWHGAGTYFPSARAHLEPRLARHASGGFDPLAYLIERAAAAGIQIHPWFTVARREDERRPEFFDDGVPEHAYDVHNESFRDFIVELILDMVRRYPVAGINLDYIRAMGICRSRSCRAEYLRRTGVELESDIAQASQSTQARDRLRAWQDQAVADIVQRVSVGARSLRPGLLISIDGNPVPEDRRPSEGRDELGWIRNGWVDVVFNMQYSDRLPLQQLDELVGRSIDPQRHALLISNYDQLDGVAEPRSGHVVADLMRLAARRWPGAPVGVYLLNMLTPEQSEALHTAPFSRAVDIAWPARPATVEP